MDILNETAYCGIYCKDCIHYRNNYSIYAQRLVDELQKVEFSEYAKIDSGFRASLKNYGKFIDVLNSLANTKCDKTCRVGGGCSGKPCKIMDCCISKEYEGCWECNEIDKCNNFDILTPVCGDMPKNNLKIIKKNGVATWKSLRNKFYIWEK